MSVCDVATRPAAWIPSTRCGETAALPNDDTRGPDWSIRLFADDAAAVLRSLGIREALVYGTSMGGRVAQDLALAHPDASGRLPSIQAPTLILHGDADLMAPVANAAVLGAGIPHSSVELVAGGRHGFFDEFAERVTSIVTGFLES